MTNPANRTFDAALVNGVRQRPVDYLPGLLESGIDVRVERVRRGSGTVPQEGIVAVCRPHRQAAKALVTLLVRLTS